MSLNTMRSLALAVAYEAIKAEREQAKHLPQDSDYAAGLMAGLKRGMDIISEQAERIPAPKPYKAPQMTPCISVDGILTVEEIT